MSPSPTSPAPVRYRPRRLRVVAWIAAVVAMLAAVALSLSPGAVSAAGFEVADRVALVGLGMIGAGVLLLFTRPVVEADAAGLRVRNIIGGYALPWGVVRAIQFERGASWATLELHDDEVVGVVAVQAVDRERAVAAVRALRAWHAAHQGRATTDG